jgi:hypothetical protein
MTIFCRRDFTEKIVKFIYDCTGNFSLCFRCFHYHRPNRRDRFSLIISLFSCLADES